MVTLKSLQGTSIEDYGYQLGRQWQIGQKDKNNGVLLIVAPNERKVRIEVGYGLEGTLTDLVSNFIIQNSILPRFRANDYPGGISRGVDDIIQVLTGDAEEWKQRAAKRPEATSDGSAMLLLILFIVVLVVVFIIIANSQTPPPGQRRRGSPWIVIPSGSRLVVVVGLGRRLMGWRIFRRRRFVRRRRLVGKLVGHDLAERQGPHHGRDPAGREQRPRARSSACWRTTPATIAWCRSPGRR